MFLWRRLVYKALCLSFALVVTLTIMQRGMFPDQIMDGSQARSQVRRELSKKTSQVDVASKFWEGQSATETSTGLTTSIKLQQWDINSTICTPNVNFTKRKWFSGMGPNFQQFLLYRHCRYFPMVINHPEKCSGDVFLLIVIKSIISQHDRREVVRDTWGKEKEVNGKKIKILFLLGTASKEEERANYQKLLDYENYIYGDILQWDFLDSFFNLTLKEVHFLKWFSIYCPNVQYIFKGDDDVYVNTDNIIEFLEGNRAKNLFVGDILYRASPIRKKQNKYYIPQELFNGTFYPPYAGGGGFLMDGPIARKLHKACGTLELYPIDDVFLGMCLKVLGITPISHEGFKTFGIVKNKASRMNKEPCFFRSMLVVHKFLPDALREMWKLVQSNLTCSKKLEIL
ncbi:UDP-GlcNAc:betaGal beta-1,3-N-acetylglucosaminyltransferase 7 isoform X1 [Latimeria chalumnae]|uniref:Hexosyltransferase n=1 Tax=Latimeria chalumnae TaxID=7897 RepID=H3A8P2_LATCH|nr:PREDICTED: UDP-GlcNAc:betaGal beta-1,3-N-acetylglucosaminyltransferase 7 [Latimeria chalumnae]|eukprot:XP_014352465.1 PREDICTED: UDP-GlcNAc:betaGal beta-1,3-N-acetylglucosaminyltransferase 7 [Latimeria chalumnae]